MLAIAYSQVAGTRYLMIDSHESINNQYHN